LLYGEVNAHQHHNMLVVNMISCNDHIWRRKPIHEPPPNLYCKILDYNTLQYIVMEIFQAKKNFFVFLCPAS